jgi:hypothetical protein
MAERVCPVDGRTFVPKNGQHRFCTPICRARYHARLRSVTAPAKYGSAHQKLRRMLAREVETGSVPCAKCGRLIAPWEDWDLGHNSAGGYAGSEHAGCNRDTSRSGRRAATSTLLESPGTLSEREFQALSEKERQWRSGDLNPRRRHSREW